MSQISDHTNDGLYHTVLDAVRRIITSINYGIQFNEGSINIQEPEGYNFPLQRTQWKQELQVALKFFEREELYEDCAQCVELIDKLDAEPTIEQIIRQLSDHAKRKED